jgi:phosphoglycolate phosphatase
MQGSERPFAIQAEYRGWHPMTATIVFDLDGTLVDSARDLAAAASELVEGLGGPPLDVPTVVPMVGDGAPLLVRRALAHAGLNPQTPGALDRFLEIYDRRLLDHTVPYDGIVEVLARLVHVGPLAVLTNKPRRASEAILEQLGLRGFFSKVTGGDGPYARKPDPSGLWALLAGTGGAGVMVGDSPADANTAAAAPCPFVLAGYGFGAGKFGAPPAGVGVAGHPRELAWLVETLTFDAARMPIVIR